MTTYRKKLIEVALPLKAINEASAREKSIRHGHPSTLHLWWARRPLAACRAVLFASLVDDPDSDPMYAGAGEEIAGAKRAELFNLIEELVQWENSNNPRVINRARAEIARSIAANKVADGEWTNDTVLELHPCAAGVPPAETCGAGVSPAEICGAGVSPAETCGAGVSPAEICGAGVPPADGSTKKAGGTPAAQLAGTRGEAVSAAESSAKRAGERPTPQAAKADKAGGTPAAQAGKTCGAAVSAAEFSTKKAGGTPAAQCSVREIKNMLATPEAVNAFLAEHAPPVLDPFCGGGSIPLEAQRLGLRAYASDLNPVPVLITKALIEIPPKFAGLPPVNPEWQRKSAEEKAARVWQGAQGLAEDVRYYGKWMRDEAEKRIGHLYPKVKITADMAKDRPDLEEYVGQELTVIAWLWARTVASPNPACRGAHVPLVTSFGLSTKGSTRAWIEPVVDPTKTSYRFRVAKGTGEIPRATVDRLRGDRCLLSNEPMTRQHIRAEASAGRRAARMMAIVAEGARERIYLDPLTSHESLASDLDEPADMPDTDIVGDTRYLTPTTYGMTKHRHLFTNRQLQALKTLTDLVMECRSRVLDASGNNQAYADAVTTYLGLCASKSSVFYTTLARWRAGEGKSAQAFGRQAIAMVWDFTEVNPFAGAGGDFAGIVDGAVKVICNLPASPMGFCSQANATGRLAVTGTALVCTDPPYYDNVPYADLSDYFYVWLRRCLQQIYPDLLGTVLVPKAEELVADHFRQGNRQKAREFFEHGMGVVAERLRETNYPNFPATIYYAFKQAEQDEDDTDDGAADTGRTSTGWETFLQGVADARWQVDGTWPMRTEGTTRMRNLGSNALASSIVMVCRPRPEEAPLARRKDFMNALRAELPDALKNLQHGNIAPVDLAQAAIGPGMAVFTRYAKVVEADGSAMSVRTALGIINQVLDEVLAEQEGEFDPDTRWALAWFAEHGMNEGPFGIAETLSKAKNTAVAGLVEAGVVKARAGKVKLVGRDELPDDWDPGADGRLTVWETTQHLIRALETHGESGAAALLGRLGGIGETARELAYRLYTLCERKKWADEALAYNGLVIAWPELSKLAHARRNVDDAIQKEIFE